MELTAPAIKTSLHPLGPQFSVDGSLIVRLSRKALSDVWRDEYKGDDEVSVAPSVRVPFGLQLASKPDVDEDIGSSHKTSIFKEAFQHAEP